MTQRWSQFLLESILFSKGWIWVEKDNINPKQRNFYNFKRLNFDEKKLNQLLLPCWKLPHLLFWFIFYYLRTIPAICRLFLKNNWCNFSLFSSSLILIFIEPMSDHCPALSLRHWVPGDFEFGSNCWFLYIVTWTYSRYMDLSKSLHEFLEVVT